jgi:hypothetical protein
MNRVVGLVKFDLFGSHGSIHVPCESTICIVLFSLDCSAKLQEFIRNWLICSFEDVDQPATVVSKE